MTAISPAAFGKRCQLALVVLYCTLAVKSVVGYTHGSWKPQNDGSYFWQPEEATRRTVMGRNFALTQKPFSSFGLDSAKESGSNSAALFHSGRVLPLTEKATYGVSLQNRSADSAARSSPLTIQNARSGIPLVKEVPPNSEQNSAAFHSQTDRFVEIKVAPTFRPYPNDRQQNTGIAATFSTSTTTLPTPVVSERNSLGDRSDLLIPIPKSGGGQYSSDGSGNALLPRHPPVVDSGNKIESVWALPAKLAAQQILPIGDPNERPSAVFPDGVSNGVADSRGAVPNNAPPQQQQIADNDRALSTSTVATQTTTTAAADVDDKSKETAEEEKAAAESLAAEQSALNAEEVAVNAELVAASVAEGAAVLSLIAGVMALGGGATTAAPAGLFGRRKALQLAAKSHDNGAVIRLHDPNQAGDFRKGNVGLIVAGDVDGESAVNGSRSPPLILAQEGGGAEAPETAKEAAEVVEVVALAAETAANGFAIAAALFANDAVQKSRSALAISNPDKGEGGRTPSGLVAGAIIPPPIFG